jgi:nitrate/nitrite transport system substrate-binding protein
MRITFARACRLAAPLAAALLVPALSAAPVEAETLAVEKPHLKLGFIKLTDMAPLAIAYEKGFFEDEGLFVTLELRHGE